MNETVFDLESHRIPVELMGDSMTIVQWLRGLWRCTNIGYANMIARAQNTLDELTDYVLRPPCAGADCVKHMYREGNTYADKLSWEARGAYTSRKRENYAILHNNKITGLRGFFDGGVSQEGSGGGWWLQALSEHHSEIIAEEAFGLHDDCTVTECECEAACRLVEALRVVADHIAVSAW